jgi:hypothetical protein
MHDPAVEERLIEAMKAMMVESEAPAEVFERLGLVP